MRNDPNPNRFEGEGKEAIPGKGMPLRNQIRNFHRNWGAYKSMHKHGAGVWWFECSGHNGYLVSGRECPLEDLPGVDLFRVGKLRDGSGVYAFDDDGDHYLLEWIKPWLAQSVYRFGRNGKDQENEMVAIFADKGGLTGYQEFLAMAVERYYPEVMPQVQALQAA